MAKYRKIDPRIWNDANFLDLSDDGKLLFLLLLTHPQMTSLGAMRGSAISLSEDLDWDPERVTESLSEALRKGMVKHDRKARFLWMPNWFRYNKPENPNVLKAWASSVDLIPECNLKAELWQSLKAFVEGLSEAFDKAFTEAFPKPFGTPLLKQEQEQEQEQEQDNNTSRTSGNPDPEPSGQQQLDAVEPPPQSEKPKANGVPYQDILALFHKTLPELRQVRVLSESSIS